MVVDNFRPLWGRIMQRKCRSTSLTQLNTGILVETQEKPALKLAGFSGQRENTCCVCTISPLKAAVGRFSPKFRAKVIRASEKQPDKLVCFRIEGNEVEVLCCPITLLKCCFSYKTGSCYWAFLPVTSEKKKKSIWRCAAVSWCLLGWQPERGRECAGTNNNKISEAVLWQKPELFFTIFSEAK